MNGNRVSIQTLVPFLSIDTGRTDLNDYLDVIAEYALEAERKIGTKKWLDEIKPNDPNGWPTATVAIKNYRGLLPKDYYDCDDIETWCTTIVCQCGNTPCTCDFGCACGMNIFNSWDLSCSCGGWTGGYRTYRIDEFRIEGCYLVAPFRTGSARIHYYAIPMDDVGYPLILQSHRDAIRAFCLYQLNTANLLTHKISLPEYRTLEARWMDLCAQARGKDNLPTRQQMGRAANMNNYGYKVKPGYIGGPYGGYGNGGSGGWW